MFSNSDDYKTFILYVIENLLAYSTISISAYSILPDHFHFMVKNNESWYKLSDFMRRIQVSYAMWFKRKYNENNRGVPVFEWRFKAKQIELNDIEDYESYISFDPIYHELVEDIRDWPYTSAHQTIQTWYDYTTQTHIKIYNEWRKISKKLFSKENHLI